MTQDICEKFIKRSIKQKLSVPGNNVTILTQTHWKFQDYFKKYYGISLPILTFTAMKDDEGIFFYYEDLMAKPAEKVLNEYIRDSKIIENIKKEFAALIKKIDYFYEKLNYNYINQTEIKKVLSILSQAMNVFWKLNIRAFFCLNFDKELCVKHLKKLGITKSSLDKIWDKAIVPSTPSFDKNRQEKILKLIIMGVKWKDIIEKCQYFGTGYNEVKRLADMGRELKNKYKNTNKKTAEKALRRQNLLAAEKTREFNLWTAGLESKEQKLAKYIQFIIWFRDARKDYMNRGLTYLHRVTEKMFSLADIPHEYIMFYTYDEMSKGMDYLIKNKEKIIARKKLGISVLSNRDIIAIQGGCFEKHKKLLLEKYSEQVGHKKDGLLIKGQIGAPGKARGLAKIIKNTKTDGYKFKKGDILVAGMTRPEFVTLMQMAAAIITDEGGITCHAAIIAREMKKPCMIGTKIATQVLKDGDFVEVDANAGVVRILKKNKKQT